MSCSRSSRRSPTSSVRLCTTISSVSRTQLRYSTHSGTGTSTYSGTTVVNAGKLRVTGAKATDKIYYRHTGYPGGIYGTSFKDMQARHPGRALEKAVKGMLPKGPLGYAMIKKLKVYAGPEHPHAAQQPKPLEI